MTYSAFEALGSRAQPEFRHARFAGDVEPEMSCSLAGYGVDVSDFPPPPPPGWSVSPPPPPPPPPVIRDAAPVKDSWLCRKRFRAAQWVWLLAVISVAAGVVAVTVTNSGDNRGAAISSATSEGASTEAPAASTLPPQTDSPSSTEPATTPTTDEPTTVPTTTAAAADEVAGSPAGVTGDRSNPVPAGAIADIGSGWRLQILNVNPDAAAIVASANQFNEPPAVGSTLTLVTVALGYFGFDDPKSAFDSTISAVGAANVELTGECGVLPQELDSFGEIFAGGVVIGNICFVTTPEDAGALEVYASGGFFGGAQVFLDASTTAANVVPMAVLPGPRSGARSTFPRLGPKPIGTPADIGAGWKLTVSGPATDITDQVLAENQFNAPPPDGFRFIGVNITYSYVGDGSASAFSVSTKAVGDSNLSLPTACGVTPREIDLTADIFSGGSVSGIVCFVAPVASPSFVLYATADFSAGKTMFATS